MRAFLVPLSLIAQITAFDRLVTSFNFPIEPVRGWRETSGEAAAPTVIANYVCINTYILYIFKQFS